MKIEEIEIEAKRPLWILRIKSQTWSVEEFMAYEKFLISRKVTNQDLWDVYLCRFAKYQREASIKQDYYDILIESKNVIKDLFSSDGYVLSKRFKFLKSHIRSAMRCLPKRGSQVIVGIFWKDMSVVKLAKVLSISRALVWEYKKSSLEKIKTFLEKLEKELKNSQPPKGKTPSRIPWVA